MPSDLARGRDRFHAWREQRAGRGRIPHSLWTLAVRLANVHGVSRTAPALGLDCYNLKKRAEAATGESPSSSPAFVELPAPVMFGKQCLFELDDGVEAILRLRLIGYETADFEAPSRGLWGAR